MVIDALQSAGDILSGLNQLKTVTELVSKIIISPQEISNNNEVIKNSQKTLLDSINYLTKVNEHLTYLSQNSNTIE